MGVLLSKYKNLVKVSLAGLSLVGVLTMAGCGGPGDVQGNLASVNGDSISMKDYFNYIQRKSTVMVDSQQGQVPARVATGQSIGFQAMRDMIIDKLIVQIAKDQGVYPSDAEVADELSFLQSFSDLNHGGNIVSDALSRGYTTDSFKNQILIDLCKVKILTKGVTITSAQVDDYIKQHPDVALFADPPRISALMILIKKEDAAVKAKVDAELAKGTPFLTAAQEYSIDPDARPVGWHYHIDNVNAMPPIVRNVLEKTDINKATDWLQSTEGFVKFYVESKVKAHPKDTTNKTLRKYVERALAQQQGAQTISLDRLLQEKIKALKENAIQIFPKGYQDTWKQLIERIRSQPSVEAPKTPLPTAPAPASSRDGAPAGNAPGAAPKTSTAPGK